MAWRSKTFDSGIRVNPDVTVRDGVASCVGSIIEAGDYQVRVPHWPARLVDVTVGDTRLPGARSTPHLVLHKRSGQRELVDLTEADLVVNDVSWLPDDETLMREAAVALEFDPILPDSEMRLLEAAVLAVEGCTLADLDRLGEDEAASVARARAYPSHVGGIGSSKAEPIGTTGKGAYGTGKHYPAGYEILRNRLIKSGMDIGKASAIAWSRLRAWAKGGGGVKKTTSANAAKVLGELHALGGEAKAKTAIRHAREAGTSQSAPRSGSVGIVYTDPDPLNSDLHSSKAYQAGTTQFTEHVAPQLREAAGEQPQVIFTPPADVVGKRLPLRVYAGDRPSDRELAEAEIVLASTGEVTPGKRAWIRNADADALREAMSSLREQMVQTPCGHYGASGAVSCLACGRGFGGPLGEADPVRPEAPKAEDTVELDDGMVGTVSQVIDRPVKVSGVQIEASPRRQHLIVHVTGGEVRAVEARSVRVLSGDELEEARHHKRGKATDAKDAAEDPAAKAKGGKGCKTCRGTGKLFGRPCKDCADAKEADAQLESERRSPREMAVHHRRLAQMHHRRGNHAAAREHLRLSKEWAAQAPMVTGHVREADLQETPAGRRRHREGETSYVRHGGKEIGMIKHEGGKHQAYYKRHHPTATDGRFRWEHLGGDEDRGRAIKAIHAEHQRHREAALAEADLRELDYEGAPETRWNRDLQPSTRQGWADPFLAARDLAKQEADSISAPRYAGAILAIADQAVDLAREEGPKAGLAFLENAVMRETQLAKDITGSTHMMEALARGRALRNLHETVMNTLSQSGHDVMRPNRVRDSERMREADELEEAWPSAGTRNEMRYYAHAARHPVKTRRANRNAKRWNQGVLTARKKARRHPVRDEHGRAIGHLISYRHPDGGMAHEAYYNHAPGGVGRLATYSDRGHAVTALRNFHRRHGPGRGSEHDAIYHATREADGAVEEAGRRGGLTWKEGPDERGARIGLNAFGKRHYAQARRKGASHEEAMRHARRKTREDRVRDRYGAKRIEHLGSEHDRIYRNTHEADDLAEWGKGRPAMSRMEHHRLAHRRHRSLARRAEAAGDRAAVHHHGRLAERHNKAYLRLHQHVVREAGHEAADDLAEFEFPWQRGKSARLRSAPIPSPPARSSGGNFRPRTGDVRRSSGRSGPRPRPGATGVRDPYSHIGPQGHPRNVHAMHDENLMALHGYPLATPQLQRMVHEEARRRGLIESSSRVQEAHHQFRVGHTVQYEPHDHNAKKHGRLVYEGRVLKAGRHHLLVEPTDVPENETGGQVVFPPTERIHVRHDKVRLAEAEAEAGWGSLEVEPSQAPFRR